MPLRTAVNSWTATFFTTLGLSPLAACGGSTVTRSGDGPNGGNGGGGNAGGIITTDGGRSIGGNAGIGQGGIGAGGSAGTGGMNDGPETAPPIGLCVNPMPRLGPEHEDTGLVSCDGNAVHRVAKRDCSSTLPRPGTCGMQREDAGMGADAGSACRSDTDCTLRALGYCDTEIPGAANCVCRYGCVRDEDCGTGELCACGYSHGTCVPATCGTDADCGGKLCLGNETDCGVTFACQRPGDGCATDTDCGKGGQCALNGDLRACRAAYICGVGRPFLVGGAARVANAVGREGWTFPVCPSTDALDAATRAALAARWTEIGLMEHASIAAFARFALELLALGAPPEFLVATHAAMADEIVHARAAFALASAYAGRPIGPGTLAVDQALSARSPLDIIETAMLEGCIGETVAAVEAAEALAHATDPAVREALARVTRDETRHAELAWRFVQWVLESGEPALVVAVRQRLVKIAETEAITQGGPPAQGAADPRLLLDHGVLGERVRREVRSRVLNDIVLPCARALVPRQPARERQRQGDFV